MLENITILQVINNIKKTLGMKRDYEVAEALGISDGALKQRKITGSIPVKEVVGLAEKNKIPLWKFMGTEEHQGFYVLQPVISSLREFKKYTEENAANYRAIPFSEDGRLAAGGGGLAFNEYHPPDSMVWVYQPEIGRPTHKLQAMRVGGNSMFPTIPPGSIVVFDCDDKEFHDGKIYVVNRGEADLNIAAVKRIRKGRSGFFLVSDNPQDPPDPVDCDWDKLVVGRVVWMWREMLEA